MIRKCLFVAVLCALLSTAYATSVQAIRIEDFRDVASRMVLDLSTTADFVVEAEADGFYVGIEGFDGKLPAVTPNSKFIRSIQLAPGGIQVSTIPGLRFERMKLSGKAVVDLFIQASTKSERMAIAAFYSKVGKLASADNAYHRLAIDYRNHDDVLYHWGLLLLKRDSPRAAEKLAMIPASSSFYAEAQRLLQGGTTPDALNKAENPPLPKVKEPTPVIVEPEAELESAQTSIPADTNYIHGIPTADVVLSRISLWDTVVELALRYFVLTIIIFISILVILCFLMSHRKSKPVKASALESPLETDAMLKMAARLTADGWTTKEIARELKIGTKEAESLIRRSHYVNSDSDNEGS